MNLCPADLQYARSSSMDFHPSLSSSLILSLACNQLYQTLSTFRHTYSHIGPHVEMREVPRENNKKTIIRSRSKGQARKASTVKKPKGQGQSWKKCTKVFKSHCQTKLKVRYKELNDFRIFKLKQWNLSTSSLTNMLIGLVKRGKPLIRV